MYENVICDVFVRQLGDYVKKDLFDLESLEEFDNLAVEGLGKF